MPDLILLFSHSITNVQKEQARADLGIEHIIVPPDTIRTLWAAFPPDVSELVPSVKPVLSWLDNHSKKEDYVLIHGDFGACFLVVQHCLNTHRIPIYSTTERKATEKILADGTVQLTHTFSHVRYRKYGK